MHKAIYLLTVDLPESRLVPTNGEKRKP